MAKHLLPRFRIVIVGAYKTSTLIDFENGKPLEVEAIWGESFRRAVSPAHGCRGSKHCMRRYKRWMRRTAPDER